jgi:hypothetical protein
VRAESDIDRPERLQSKSLKLGNTFFQEMTNVVKINLNRILRYTATVATMVGLLVGATVLQAQTAKPVLVVSLPSTSELLANIDFLGSLGGQPGASQMVNGMLMGMTQGQGLKGLDQSRPLSLAIGIAPDGQFTPVAYIPVSSTKDLIDTLTKLHAVASVEDENGVLKVSVAGGQELFVHDQNGWAIVTQAKDALLPTDDPMKLIKGLNPDYDIAVRIMLQNVPEEKKKSAIEQFRGFMEFAAAQQRQQAGDNPLATLNEKNLEQQVATIERLLKEADQITIGWKIDRGAKDTYLDFGVTAVPGSHLDQELKQMADIRTNFAGFIMPEAAVTLSFCGKNSQENIDQTLTTLDQLKGRADDAIDKDQDLANDKRDSVKKVLAQFIDVAESTVKSGTSDGGAVVQLGAGKIQAAAGGFVSDGAALEKAVKDLITLAQGEPDFQSHATVKLDLETYKNVKFHQITVKLPDEAGEDAKKVFGDSVDVYFGAGPTSAYFAAGKGSLDLVKSVIDRSAADPNKAVQPVQMSIALSPIADFVGSMSEQNAEHAEVIKKALSETPGKDHVTLNAHIVPNGMSYRFELQEGVLKAIGVAAMAGRGAHPAGHGPNR